MSGHVFPLIEVSGTSFEMGCQHGAQASELIERYLIWIEKLTAKHRDVLCRNAMAFLPLVERLSPAYVEEVKGLAEGAGISFEEAMLCQARAEAAQIPEGCSAFAITGSATADRQPLAGQNQDLEPEYADVGIVLRIKPTDGRPRAILFTFAGQLGYTGMNEHGVCLFNNALYDFPWQMGLPKYPMQRVVLEKHSVAECIEVLQQYRACSASNMVLCDGEGRIADVEIRPDRVVMFRDEHPDCVLHTNHYLTQEFKSFETNSLRDSCPRLDRLRVLVNERWGELTVQAMKDILSDHANDPAGICRHGGARMHSISGYIAEPARGVFHIRRGHGCLGTWQAYAV